MICHPAHRYICSKTSLIFGAAAVGFTYMQIELINFGYYKSAVLDNLSSHSQSYLLSINEGKDTLVPMQAMKVAKVIAIHY